MTRRRLALLMIGSVVISATVGWVAGSQIRSPAEVAAASAPPEPSPILVPVENRILSTDVVTRGTARFGSPQNLIIAPSALKPGAGVLARVPLPGAELVEGDVILTASNRPVFLLVGEQPSFRDLGPGMVGEDVRQLQEALKRLRFDPGTVDGVYGDSTETAVASWYQAAGFSPFETTAGQLAGIRALEADLLIARLDLVSARDQVAAANGAIATASAEHAGVVGVAPPSAVAAAQAEAASANKVAAAEAAAKLSALNALLSTGEAATTDIATAQSDLALAQANAESVRLAGDRAVAEANDAAFAAAVAASTAASTAQAAFDSSHAARSLAAEAVRLRGALVDLAVSQLGEAKRQAGIQVPSDEVIFVSSAPVRVAELTLGRGDALAGPVMTATDAVVFVDGSLPLDAARLVSAGMKVKIDETDLGIEATGIVGRVAAVPGTNGVDGFHVYFETTVDQSPPNVVGASLRLTISIESSGGQVLAVPVSALSLATDGTSRVQRERAGVLEYIKVEPGLAADGFVGVTAASGDLAAGDLVLIGFEQPAPSG